MFNNQNKEIEIIGVLDNQKVLDIISKSSGVVITTKMFEGQPTLLCEASALGVPSIFPKTGGISEFFPDNYPLAYEQFNYDDLKNKLLRVHDEELLTTIGVKNKEFIVSYLNDLVTNQNLISLIDRE